MSDMVTPLLEWLHAHPHLAGLVTFLISAGESVAILGTIVPGSIMMTAIGALAGAGVIPLWSTIVWAILGAIVGDGISYWIGHYFKDRLPTIWPFRRYPSLLKSGETFFYKYGSMSVFIGRFVGPVRALVPLVAGMLGMRPLQFTIANVASAIGWAPAYMLPGILLGAASMELPREIAIHVILVLVLIGLFALLCMWFIWKLYLLIHHQINRLQNKIWLSLKHSRYFSATTVVLKHYNPKKTHGQFGLALLFLLAVILYILLASYVKYHGPANIMINDTVYHFFRGLSLRVPNLDSFMINVTLLGQKEVLFPAIVGLAAWLFFAKHKRAALHVLGLGIMTAIALVVLKHLWQIPRPWGTLIASHSYSMPSGHTTGAATLYLGLALLLITAIREKYARQLIIGLALTVAVLVALSRLYLGAHWFTDVVGGWLLSISLLSFIVISYQRQKEKPIHFTSCLLVSVLVLGISFAVVHHFKFAKLKIAYTQLPWPISIVQMEPWWQNNGFLPSYRTSLFGFRSQQINIQWIGNLDAIRRTLLAEGWSRPPARNLVSIIHRVADVSSTQYLPLISPQYLDKKPELILTRLLNNEKNLIVVRLWDSSVRLANGQILWVGTIDFIPRSYQWLSYKTPNALEVDPLLLFPHSFHQSEWEWKVIIANLRIHPKKIIHRKIMLIRARNIN